MQRLLASTTFFSVVACSNGFPSAFHKNIDAEQSSGGLRGLGKITRLMETHSEVSTVPPKCHESKAVGSSDNKFLKCPAECPVWADNKNDGVHCNFECVEATREACTARNPKETVPDVDRGICRACIVYGCDRCAGDGTDTCGKCGSGYYLVDGKCENSNQGAWNVLFVFLALFGLFMIGWIIDLCRRPITNGEQLKAALNARSRSKLRQPRGPGESPRHSRHLWPLTTNLLTQNVAGLGVLLKFNFFNYTIWWGIAVGIGWWILAQAVDTDLLILGTRRAITSRQNCILVAWGWETQHRLMWTKVLFTQIVYVASFVCCILMALRQQKIAENIDAQNTTHKDFAARIEGLPLIAGTVKVEEELIQAVADATGHKVVNVSVAWDFQEHEDDVFELIGCDLYDLEKQEAVRRGSAKDEPAELPPDSESIYANLERSLLAAECEQVVAKRKAPRGDHVEPIGETVRELDIVEILATIKTCPDAYAVFETEAARNAAVEAASQRGGVEYRGNSLTLSRARVEPQSVQWKNCANTDMSVKAARIAMGFGLIFAGLALWVFVFYLPYAWFTLTFDYTYGQEPGFAAGFTFSMIVVAGNQMMYFVCSEVADRTRFIYVDDREVCYMLLFCFACTFNVLLDLITTYYVAYRVNVGLGMKTYHGVPLAELEHFTEIFETYAMQRRLAGNLWAYAFPSTFLVPFFIEPVVTIIVPYQFMAAIVARQPQIRGYNAEVLLCALVMDLSRYADVLLNVMIAVLIFFFPGGYNVQMFVALGLSHMFVYAFDQYRFLQSAQSCEFADSMIDKWAQWILCIPLGSIAACFVYKANCEPGYHCIKGTNLVLACAAAFIGHIIVHTIVLVFVVPMFQKEIEGDDAETAQYKDCSSKHAASWFAVNPIYCLRSEFVYEHNPPCKYLMPGKEHILQPNPEIGLYFSDQAAAAEDFHSFPVNMSKIKEGAKKIWSKHVDKSADGSGSNI